jgi:hypothetical protein
MTGPVKLDTQKYYQDVIDEYKRLEDGIKLRTHIYKILSDKFNCSESSVRHIILGSNQVSIRKTKSGKERKRYGKRNTNN